MDFCQTARTTSQIMTHLGLTHREHFRSDTLQPLLLSGLLFPTIPGNQTVQNRNIV
ncbi:MAG: Fic family protein [Spirochaetota bacterium]